MSKVTISREIHYLKIDEITDETLHKVVDFVKNQPRVKESEFSKGRTINIKSVRFNLNDENHPSSVTIEHNSSGIMVETKIELHAYYYIRDEAIEKVSSLDDITFW